MGKRPTILLALLTGLAGSSAGCNRQDTECLGGIGRKIMDRAGAASTNYREKLGSLKSTLGPTDSLQDRVNIRLQLDKALADTPIEVVVSGSEVELKGTVKSTEQRARAVELAESTVGVERVLVSLTMPEEKKGE